MLRKLRSGRQRGGALAEWALTVPVLACFALGCVQFAVLFETYMSVMNVTRDATRWIAIHPHNTDTTLATNINSRLPSNLSSSALTLTVSPSCASLTSGQCSGRTPGTMLTVTSTYSITSKLFLGSTFGWGPWTFTVPSTLPAYSMYMQVEPS
ncbi:MAG: TadE/TadG family type IV pilus assembly protein [Chloroflexota bacterium]